MWWGGKGSATDLMKIPEGDQELIIFQRPVRSEELMTESNSKLTLDANHRWRELTDSKQNQQEKLHADPVVKMQKTRTTGAIYEAAREKTCIAFWGGSTQLHLCSQDESDTPKNSWIIFPTYEEKTILVTEGLELYSQRKYFLRTTAKEVIKKK